jgi:hypothetical protein
MDSVLISERQRTGASAPARQGSPGAIEVTDRAARPAKSSCQSLPKEARDAATVGRSIPAPRQTGKRPVGKRLIARQRFSDSRFRLTPTFKAPRLCYRMFRV